MAKRPVTSLRSGDALLAFDADLAIVSWNRAAEVRTGVSADEAVGRHCSEVLVGRDEDAKVLAGRLELADGTVRNYIRAILAALKAHSQLGALAKARRAAAASTVVRAVLLPATTLLLGDWNWYVPRQRCGRRLR